MICPVTYGNPTVMTRVAFKKICQAKRHEKITGWAGRARNYGPVYPQCADCKAGVLIAAGKDFPRPDNLEFIEIADVGAVRVQPSQIKLEKEKVMQPKNEKTNNDSPFKTVPEVIDNIRLSDLRPHWKTPVAAAGTIAPCVNCGNISRTRKTGLCPSCENYTNKKRGEELIDALAQARLRRKRQYTKKTVSLTHQPTAMSPPQGGTIQSQQPTPISHEPHPIYLLGQRYKALGEILMDQSTSISALVAVAGELGLRIDFNIEVGHGK